MPNLLSLVGSDVSPSPRDKSPSKLKQRSWCRKQLSHLSSCVGKKLAPAKHHQAASLAAMGGSEEEAGAGSQAPLPLSLGSRWSKLIAPCLGQPPLPG